MPKKKKSKIEEVAEEIEAGSEKADAIKEIAKAMKNDSVEELTKLMEMMDRYGATREDSVLKDVMNMLVLQRALKSLEGDGKKEESMADTLRETLKMVLPLKIVQGIIETKPDQDPVKVITMLQAMNAIGKNDSKMMEVLLRMQQESERRRAEEQRRQIEMLQEMIRQKEIEEMKKEQEKQREEILSRLQSMEELYLKSREEGSIAKGLAKVLNDYIQVRDAVMKFAEEQGLKKEEVVTPSGKINWGKILTDWGKRGMTLLEKYLEAQSKQPPAYTPPSPPTFPREELAKRAEEQIMETQAQEQAQEPKEEGKESYDDIVQVSVQEETPKAEEKPEPAEGAEPKEEG